MNEDRFAALERELRYLRDRQDILDCIVRTSRGNDLFDKELITGSYHPDGRHELGREIISGAEYGEIDGDVAHAESYVIGLFADKGAATSRILAGRYIDRLERRDGRWGIVLRRATVEVAMEGKAILPNGNGVLGSGYLKGNRDRSDPSYQRPLTTEGGERW